MKTANVAAAPPRTLILTHLRRGHKQSLELGRRMWQLRDPVFGDRSPFARRLALQEEGRFLPEDVDLTGRDAKMYSTLGELPEAILEFTARGDRHFVLGGGNLDCCLFNTFASLVRLKSSQGESASIAIPLALTYQTNGIKDLLEYLREDNPYLTTLENYQQENRINGFRVVQDNRVFQLKTGAAPRIELHWFTSLNDLFRSAFFPEATRPEEVSRLTMHFNLRRLPPF
jgi:hypothetical protein